MTSVWTMTQQHTLSLPLICSIMQSYYRPPSVTSFRAEILEIRVWRCRHTHISQCICHTAKWCSSELVYSFWVFWHAGAVHWNQGAVRHSWCWNQYKGSYIYCTFRHLAEAFIKVTYTASKLHIYILSVLSSLGIERIANDHGVVSVMLCFYSKSIVISAES